MNIKEISQQYSRYIPAAIDIQSGGGYEECVDSGTICFPKWSQHIPYTGCDENGDIKLSDRGIDAQIFYLPKLGNHGLRIFTFDKSVVLSSAALEKLGDLSPGALGQVIQSIKFCNQPTSQI